MGFNRWVCMYEETKVFLIHGEKINMKRSFLIAILELVLFTSASSSSQVAPLYDVTMLNDASLICIKSLPGKAGYLFIFFSFTKKIFQTLLLHHN